MFYLKAIGAVIGFFLVLELTAFVFELISLLPFGDVFIAVGGFWLLGWVFYKTTIKLWGN